MTDVRQTTATIVLPEDLDGRVFIRNAARELVAEVSKPAGRRVEIGVEPGAYEIRLERAKASMSATAKVLDGSSVTMEPKQFGPAALEPTRSRGTADVVEPLAVAGRNRLALRFGAHTTAAHTVISGVDSTSVAGGIQYSRYLREDLAMTIGFSGGGGASGTSVSTAGVFSGSFGVLSLPIGVQWNPFGARHRGSALKPYVAFAIGPVFGASSGSIVVPGSVISATTTQGTVGGDIGGGVDFHLARSFALGVYGGYNWMAPFARPVAVWSNHSGGGVGISLGFLFGKGR